jgi:LysM repeat protein
MKQIRFSPWLILVLAVVLVFAAGCERPDPQVEIATPVPQQPQQPQTAGTAVPGAEATPTLPIAVSTEQLGAVTPVPGTETTPAAPDSGQPQSQATVTPVPTAVPPAAQPTTPAPGTPIVHTVKPGETLFSIGRLYNVNPYAIAAANNIPYPYIIYPGQQLTIPSGTTTATATPPPAGTSPTPVPPPSSGTCRYYHKVLPGENLFRISMAYGVPMSTIAAANGIVNYNLIYAGQTLCIP